MVGVALLVGVCVDVFVGVSVLVGVVVTVGVLVGVLVLVGVCVGVTVFVGVGVGVGKITGNDCQVTPPTLVTGTLLPLESAVGLFPSVNNNKVVPETDVNGYCGV